jgi:hypothetical protein
MSYVHCGGCGRAFHVGARTACPACAWRPGGRPSAEARVREALATIEVAVAEQPRLAGLVRQRLAGLYAEPVETSLVAPLAEPGAITTPAEDPRLRMLVAAMVIALAARFQQAAEERPRLKRGIGLARRVLSRFV